VVLSSNCEGLSLPVSEGMAAGKPVVGSNVPDVRALVRGTGLIFEKGGDTGMDLPQEGHFGRENFCAFWNRNSQGMFAVFAKELLITVFVVTVVVDAGRATPRARWSLALLFWKD